MWNEFVSSAMKASALLHYVALNGNRPPGMNAAAVQVWEALVTIGAIRGCNDTWSLSAGGMAMREVYASAFQ
jgi:hypothetical protein